MEAEVKRKMYFYEEFAGEFDSKMNMYDTNKRLDVVFNELLKEDIAGKKVLDAGCGTGWFSKGAAGRGAYVVSMDLGEKLLAEVAKKVNSERVVGSILEMPFPDNWFDIVISSEVIEHTPEPFAGVKEMYRVLKPGGVLVLTTPNKFWYFSVWIANKLGLRPYQGLENWTGWLEMKRKLAAAGFTTEKMAGVHLLPFVSPLLYPLLNFFHRFNGVLGPVMINIAVRCKK